MQLKENSNSGEKNKAISSWIKGQKQLESSGKVSSDVFFAKAFKNTTFANKLFAEIDQMDWNISVAQDAKDVVKSLLEHHVAIDKLLSEHAEKIFKTDNTLLLQELYTVWPNQSSLTDEEKIERKKCVQKAYSKRLTQDESFSIYTATLTNCPVDLIHTMIQKPKNVSDLQYIEILLGALQIIEPTKDSVHTTMKILILNQIRIYESIFKSQAEALNDKKITELQDNLDEFKIPESSSSDLSTLQNIEVYIKDRKQNDQSIVSKLVFGDNNKRLALNIYNTLGFAGIDAPNFRNGIIDYVINSKNDAEKALKYAVAVAQKNKATSILNKIAGVNKQYGLAENNDNNKKLLQSLKTILGDPRVSRRMVAHIVKNFKKLDGDNKRNVLAFNDGYDNVEQMLKLMQVLDYQTSVGLDLLMSDVMKELKSQYNLDPSFFGAVDKYFNYVMSYPIWLFFYVLDYISDACEYLWTWGTQQTSSTVIQEFDKAFKDINQDINNVPINSAQISPEDKLRNNLLDAVKAYNTNPSININDLKKFITIKPNDLKSTLQAKVQTLQECIKSKDFACAAYKLLDNIEMKQGINQLPIAGNAARGFAMFSKISAVKSV